MTSSVSVAFSTTTSEVGNYKFFTLSEDLFENEQVQTELPEKEEKDNKKILKELKKSKSEVEAKILEQRKSHKRYKFKLYLTCIVIASIIIATWVSFIVPLCLCVYAVLLSTYKIIPYNVDLSDNTTFLNTFSNVDSCPYNETEAFASLHSYSSWLQSTYSNQSESPLNSSYGIMIKNTTCVSNFVNNGTQCTPECFAYTPAGGTYFITWRVFIFIGAFVSFAVCLLGIATWVKLGGKLWSFPQIIFFYIICMVLIQSACILSGQIVPQRFYCKHRGLIESRADPTIFCQIQGGLFHYSAMAFMNWYLFAVMNLLYIVILPFSGAAHFQAYKRRIHLFESVFCWTFPLLFLIGTITLTKGYTFVNLAEFCYPSDLFTTITLFLPSVILCLFNVTAIGIVVGILLKRHYLLTKLIGRRMVSLVWVVQLAVLTVAFTLSVWLVLFQYTLYKLKQPAYNAYLDQYSRCVTIFGRHEFECCRREYRNHGNHPVLSVTSGFFTCVWGVAGISIGLTGTVKELWRKAITCIKRSRCNK